MILYTRREPNVNPVSHPINPNSNPTNRSCLAPLHQTLTLLVNRCVVYMAGSANRHCVRRYDKATRVHIPEIDHLRMWCGYTFGRVGQSVCVSVPVSVLFVL